MDSKPESAFACPACGEPNPVDIEIEDGADQEFVVDCWVCCRPARVTVHIRGDEVSVRADSALG